MLIKKALAGLFMFGVLATAARAEIREPGVYEAHLRSAKAHAKYGKYLQAEREYQAAISAAASEKDLWEAGASLKDFYITFGQYKGALVEIDWLIQHGAGEDVKGDLLKQKELIVYRTPDKEEYNGHK